MSLATIYWSHLKKLNSARPINTMYVWIFLVPIFAKLLESVGGEAELTIFNHTLLVNLQLPFSWVAFYFSALSFAMANLIFQLRCPRVVKEQNDYFEFRHSNRGVEHLDGYMPDIEMNWEGLRQLLEEQDRYFSDVAEALNPKSSDHHLRKRFWAVYAHGNSARQPWARAAAALYLLGGVLITVVLGQNAIFVVGYLIGW